MVERVRTPRLEIAYHRRGPSSGPVVVLVHGWPDDPSCWDGVVPELAENGFCCVLPYLRGTGPTRFLDDAVPRSGQIGALAADLADFVTALELSDVLLVGHDWGARAGYAVAALFPQRIRGLVAMSAGYATGAALPYELAHNYWYEWFTATERGRAAYRDDRRELSRYLWSSWSPPWPGRDEQFDRTAPSWDNPDWAEISIHAYLHRWHEAPGDPAYDDIESRLAAAPPIKLPTLVVHGELDRDNTPATTDGKDELFTGWYERQVLAGAGHFVPREAPQATSAAIHRLATVSGPG
ncbi:alpha/beta fold hydrolase [Amycolatopsis sp. SID8362]|nr:alpha/beta hydrolase [Amycolatopsis sp. SID8362]NBH01740.1 alpha/beta fold hydrolase [Amycolatopsis sp. SID8362]NED38441.1 alpha/beta hydrolase [Amycolatopsis sp. SID8362]